MDQEACGPAPARYPRFLAPAKCPKFLEKMNTRFLWSGPGLVPKAPGHRHPRSAVGGGPPTDVCINSTHVTQDKLWENTRSESNLQEKSKITAMIIIIEP